MWLLNAFTFELEWFEEIETPPYYILSHRWEQAEVTFDDILNKTGKSKKGWSKIYACCQQAIRQTKDEVLVRQQASQERDSVLNYLEAPVYVWIDTCCINKSNSSELSEAINSMYNWYERATLCYAYLADVTENDTSQIKASLWFTRCWTLQELLAPQEVLFFDCNWKQLGWKSSIAERLEEITGIPQSALARFEPNVHSVAERMSWASRRRSTRKEDKAYSLLGIFNVNMPMIYGEGPRAFTRLLEAILRESEDLSIFSWSNVIHKGVDKLPGLLASSPSNYMKQGVNIKSFSIRTDSQINRIKLMDNLKIQWQGTSMTSAGISLDIYLIPYCQNLYLAPIAWHEDMVKSPNVPGYRERLRPDYAEKPNSRIVYMLLERKSDDGYYRRISINDRTIFEVPEDWFSRGRIRRVILANDNIVAFPSEVTKNQVLVADASYGVRIESIGFDKIYKNADIRLLSQMESEVHPRDLSLYMASHGVAGMIMISFSDKPLTFFVFGYDFDFNLLCLVVRPDEVSGSDSERRQLTISIPRLSRRELYIQDHEDMMKLMLKMQSDTDEDWNLSSDRVSLHIMPWNVQLEFFQVPGLGEISLERLVKTRFRVQVDIDIFFDEFSPVCSGNGTRWYEKSWFDVQGLNEIQE